jgi:serine protease DegQ
LAKGNGFDDLGQASGMHCLFIPTAIGLVAVDDGSPVSEAGLRAKDILLSLNGKPVSKLKPAAVRHLLNQKGKPVRVTVERDGKRMEFRFTPKEYD